MENRIELVTTGKEGVASRNNISLQIIQKDQRWTCQLHTARMAKRFVIEAHKH